MATAGDGAAPYQGGGAGGKFRKRPIRRSAPATPYDRPPTALRNNSPSLFAKLVDPASRLIYAGADRLFGVFRRRLPSLPSQRPPETSEEPRNGLQEAGPNNSTGAPEPSTDQGGNLASISTVTEISELEHMLKQKTFSRSEIERLTTLLHSRTADSPSDDVNEGDRAKIPSTSSHLLRLEASASGPGNKHVEERENFRASILTPAVNSRTLEEDVASPAELAKAYMGTRPAKVSPSTLRLGSQALRQDSVLLSNTTVLPKTSITSLAPKTAGSFRGLENGFTTPRSRGRSAMYNMARTPYYRGPSTFSQKGIKSDYGHGGVSPSLILSQSACEQEGPVGSSKMALKRRSSVLDDDIGSGGPMRRIRQKSNLLLQGGSLSKHRRELGSSAFQQPGAACQKLLLRNEPEPKVSKAVEENGETSMRSSGYAPVPTKSTHMASKILEQLERLSPKEKPSGSRLAGTSEKLPTKLKSNVIHGQSLGSMEKVDSPKFLPSPQDNQKSEGQHHAWLFDTRESTSQSKDKVEENGPRKFAIPRNVLSTMNGNSMVPVRETALIVTNTDSTLKLPAEPPQKKRAFQMSAHEDSLELDDDNHSNGHVSIPLGENKKPETYVVANKDVSAEALAEVIQTAALPEVCKTSPPEVVKIPAMPEFKKIDNAISPPKTDVGPPGGSVVNEQKIGFNFSTSPPSSSSNQSAMLSQSTLIVDTIAPQKESKAFPTFGTSTKNAEKVPPLFSANEPSGFKPNSSSDAKPPSSTSLFNSVTKKDHVQFSVSNKDDNGNGQKSVNMFGNSESLSSDSPTSTSTSGVFSFGGSTKNSSITNGTPASNPFLFSSSSPFPASGTGTNKLFNSSSSHILSSGSNATCLSSTTTIFASSSVFSTSAAPIFSFGSAIASSTSASMAPTSVAEAPDTNATKDKEPKSNTTSSSPFASTSFATASTESSIFGYRSPAATSTTNNQFQGSVFNAASGSQANTQVVPFQFGSSAPSLVSGTTGIPSSTSGPFGSSAPAFSSAPSFGLSSAVASSETKSGCTKSGCSISGSTTNIFSSALSSAPSFGLSSAVASSETTTGSSTSGSTPNIFGSAFSSTPSFGLSSTVALSETRSCSSTSGSTTSVFGSAWQPPKSSAFGSTFGSPSTAFSFEASSTSMPSASSSPIVFGSSNAGASTGSSMFSFTAAGATNPSFPTLSQGQSVFGNSTPVFGAANASPNNNDQMSMEDSMAEDSMQTPNPSVPAFGQAPAGTPGFMFGSATPTPQTVPFQFGGQQNQAPSHSPFQASGSVEFNAGGSFSLGSGGVDKSGRRIVRVKNKNRRK